MTQSQKATFQFWRDEAKKAFKAFVAERTEANKRVYEFAVQKRNEAIYNWQEETVS